MMVHSFLENRSQKMLLGTNYYSILWSLAYRIPPHHFIPQLFNIYMKLLSKVVRTFGIYADDLQLHLNLSSRGKEGSRYSWLIPGGDNGQCEKQQTKGEATNEGKRNW